MMFDLIYTKYLFVSVCYDSILRRRKPSFVGLRRHEGMQTLVDHRSPYGLHKKPHGGEAGRLTAKG